MPHQQQALDWAKDRSAIALFMQMRLGKSAVAIRWAKNRLTATLGSVLIVTPLTTFSGWQDELALEGETDVVSLHGLNSVQRYQCAVNESHRWYLLNYEAARIWKELIRVPWSAVILDESTRIKNPKAQVTKTLLRLDDTPARAILTGLPNPEGPMDYFTQMAFVTGRGFMGFHNFWAWRDALFVPVGYDWVPRRGVRERIKDEVAKHAFVMTRKQAKVGSVLVHEKRVVEMNAAQRVAWRDIKKNFKFGDVETKSAGTQHVWLQRVAGGFSPDRASPEVISSAKFDELVELLRGDLRGESVVVWFHFNEELAFVYHGLKEAGFSVTALLGSTPKGKRPSRIRKFQRGVAQIICVQEALGQYGLDLSVADTEVYYSNSWSYELRSQSQDRIIHPRKTHPLLSIDLITKGTTDEDVVDTLRDKRVDAQSFTSTLLTKIRNRLHGTDREIAQGQQTNVSVDSTSR